MSETYVSKSREWLEPYVHDLMRSMKLEHWWITLEDDLPESIAPDSDAAAWVAENYNRAKLYIGDPDGDMNQLRWRIVHELVHLLTRDWERAVDSLEQHLNPAAWSIAEIRLEHEMEQAVEAIAFAWSPLLPLPIAGDAEATDDQEAA